MSRENSSDRQSTANDRWSVVSSIDNPTQGYYNDDGNDNYHDNEVAMDDGNQQSDVLEDRCDTQNEDSTSGNNDNDEYDDVAMVGQPSSYRETRKSNNDNDDDDDDDDDDDENANDDFGRNQSSSTNADANETFPQCEDDDDDDNDDDGGGYTDAALQSALALFVATMEHLDDTTDR
eukprot:CAMPEP_0116553178 /NCGR_PEP_ID=MMETSP0397-20121206/6910_1 /TAXON_ID=216820 /ORGANISM="Cyclophora tenuis, Strain ECT3854" /LENGTH=176 /DNA_ID=CAMNT_0004078235 /DNA_START=22 /DNA_END=552 /DNA_ORIENTATION=-